MALVSAGLTHVSVRHCEGRRRITVFAAAIIVFVAATYFGDALGGFWPGFYTLIVIYTLATAITPWIDLWARSRRG